MSGENLEIRDLILLAALPHVVFEGWTPAAMQAGIDDLGDLSGLGLDAGAMAGERVFPGGMTDMAAHFSSWADRRMIAEMARMDTADMRVRDRVAAGVRARLQVLIPHREAVRRLLAFLALPHHVPMAVSCGYDTLNEIWYAAGDESADFNFYTKRALLAPVLVSTALYWLGDDGDEAGDYPQTWAFLDRRLDEVLKIPSLKARATKRLSQIPTPSGIIHRFATIARARRSS